MSARAAAGFAGRMEPSSKEQTLAELDRLADLLDTRWRIPGTSWRFGLDAVMGLLPVAGDLSAALMSAYMVKKARDLGAPNHVIARMVGNVALDTVVGSVPILGSVFDFAFKANRRNMKLLRTHFGRV